LSSVAGWLFMSSLKAVPGLRKLSHTADARVQ
jgi:hypothetical protein